METNGTNKLEAKQGWADKWVTVAIYVDIETGEIITKGVKEKSYIKIRSTVKIERNEHYAIRKFTIECERNRQQSLF